jgi:hypothetical protein
VWQWNHFARTLAIEDISAVSTMMFSVRKAECSATAHAHVRVYPFRRL